MIIDGATNPNTDKMYMARSGTNNITRLIRGKCAATQVRSQSELDAGKGLAIR
jgi:hypothetical protein